MKVWHEKLAGNFKSKKDRFDGIALGSLQTADKFTFYAVPAAWLLKNQ